MAITLSIMRFEPVDHGVGPTLWSGRGGTIEIGIGRLFDFLFLLFLQRLDQFHFVLMLFNLVFST